jgi:hypothetical protein
MSRAGFYGGSQQYKGCLNRLVHRGREVSSWVSPDEFALKNTARSCKGASAGLACGRLSMPSIVSLVHFLGPTPASRERTEMRVGTAR